MLSERGPVERSGSILRILRNETPLSSWRRWWWSSSILPCRRRPRPPPSNICSDGRSTCFFRKRNSLRLAAIALAAVLQACIGFRPHAAVSQMTTARRSARGFLKQGRPVQQPQSRFSKTLPSLAMKTTKTTTTMTPSVSRELEFKPALMSFVTLASAILSDDLVMVREKNEEEGQRTGLDFRQKDKNPPRSQRDEASNYSAPDEDEEAGDGDEDSGGDGGGDGAGESAETRRRVAAARAALLKTRQRGSIASTAARPSRKSPASQNRGPKRTSVGARRVGSATRARGGAAGRAMESLRKAARVASAGGNGPAQETTRKPESDGDHDGATSGTPNAAKAEDDRDSKTWPTSIIHSTIEDILNRPPPPGQVSPEQEGDSTMLTAAFSSFGRTIGVLGDSTYSEAQRDGSGVVDVPPGCILVPPSLGPGGCTDRVSVRVATPSDDVGIANLRLSVFSDFSADLRGQFCARSCHAIASRRLRGATCVVATVPAAPAPQHADGGKHPQRSGGGGGEIVLGSAECSFHEFYGTRLGLRRPNRSILYVTEVAVSPAARRRGIGSRLLRAVDVLARTRCAETLYLHVDVLNVAAIALYENAGYQRVASPESMYLEFTTSLNLHPGATKGRDHFLFYKDLTPQPTWLPSPSPSRICDDTPLRRGAQTPLPCPKLVGSLGIEIPA